MDMFRRTAGFGAALLLAALSSTPGLAQVGRNPGLRMPAPDDEHPTPAPPDDEDPPERNDGVIAPPGDVDPDMHVTPENPDAGRSMPVIPPPDDGQDVPK